MPNRIIKESIITSASLENVSFFDEVLFTHLIVSVDDFGRYDGRVKVIRSRLFPLKEVSLDDVAHGLDSLERAGVLQRYSVHGEPFIQLTGWANHQQIRNMRSKYPSPEDADNLQSIDINCNQLQSNDINCASNPIQSNPIQSNPNPIRIQSESVSNPTPAEAAYTQEAFDLFWKSYPKHTGLEEAEKEFAKAVKDVDILTLVDSVHKHRRTVDWKKNGGQFIPKAAKFLAERMWLDDCKPAPGSFDQRDGVDLNAMIEQIAVKLD